eukprot:SAG22_NODE_1436_length_4421_cov_9.840583_3_plen_293_part_00
MVLSLRFFLLTAQPFSMFSLPAVPGDGQDGAEAAPGPEQGRRRAAVGHHCRDGAAVPGRACPEHGAEGTEKETPTTLHISSELAPPRYAINASPFLNSCPVFCGTADVPYALQCLVFELVVLKGRLAARDQVVAWGAFPVCDAAFRYSQGCFKTQLLFGEVDRSVRACQSVLCKTAWKGTALDRKAVETQGKGSVPAGRPAGRRVLPRTSTHSQTQRLRWPAGAPPVSSAPGAATTANLTTRFLHSAPTIYMRHLLPPHGHHDRRSTGTGRLSGGSRTTWTPGSATSTSKSP